MYTKYAKWVFQNFQKIHNGGLKIEKNSNSNLGPFLRTNYIKIKPTNILKPKNMINIPWILAKCKKSSDLRNCRKIYRHPNYGPAIIQVGSNFLPKIAKKLKKWNFKHFFWFTKVISAYFAFFGLLFLCMPDLWPKGFTYRKFQVVMINGSEIMTSSILKNICWPPFSSQTLV